MDNIRSLLGLALRAGRLAVGEEPVAAASRSHKAYLLLLASDAADNTIRRASHYTQAGGNTICHTLPLTKEELGGCLGRASCAMLAVTDVGFAASLAQQLAKIDPETYGPARDVLVPKARRANKRRKETRAQRAGGRGKPGRPTAAPQEKEIKTKTTDRDRRS